MNAAIYARKSTEQKDVDTADKSVARQVELAQTFATSRGWAVDPAHIYVDDGISGAETTKLLSRARMLAASEAPRPPFDVLVVMSLDRLSRDDEELPSVVYALRDAGVRIFAYQDGQEIVTATAFNRGMLAMRSTFAAAEREAAQLRTREGMARKAAAGYWTGANVFGYDRERVGSHTELKVNEMEAAVVRRIFELSAAGYGINKLARQLSLEHPGLRKWSA
jgi:site-specific DNA recombinase